jgi:hypothetical protein
MWNKLGRVLVIGACVMALFSPLSWVEELMTQPRTRALVSPVLPMLSVVKDFIAN